MRRIITTLLTLSVVAGCGHIPSRIERMQLTSLKRALAECYVQRPELAADRTMNPNFLVTDKTGFSEELAIHKRAFDRCWADHIAKSSAPKEQPFVPVAGPGCVMTAYPIEGSPRVAKPIMWQIPTTGIYYVPLGHGETDVYLMYHSVTKRNAWSASHKDVEDVGSPAELAKQHVGKPLSDTGSCQILRQRFCHTKQLTYCPRFRQPPHQGTR